MTRAATIGGACGVLCAACASAWTMSVRAHLQHPMPAACVEQALLAQQIVDTTAVVADRLGGTGLEPDSGGGSYAEVAFAVDGSRAKIVQTRDAQGEPIVTVSWTWSESLPADDSVNAVERWMLASLDAWYSECVGDSNGPEDVVVLRTWTLPDSAR